MTPQAVLCAPVRAFTVPAFLADPRSHIFRLATYGDGVIRHAKLQHPCERHSLESNPPSVHKPPKMEKAPIRRQSSSSFPSPTFWAIISPKQARLPDVTIFVFIGDRSSIVAYPRSMLPIISYQGVSFFFSFGALNTNRR